MRQTDEACPFCPSLAIRLSPAVVLVASALLAREAAAQVDGGVDSGAPDAGAREASLSDQERDRFIVPLYGAPPHRGGCGCETTASPSSATGLLVGVGAMATAFFRRRKERG